MSGFLEKNRGQRCLPPCRSYTPGCFSGHNCSSMMRLTARNTYMMIVPNVLWKPSLIAAIFWSPCQFCSCQSTLFRTNLKQKQPFARDKYGANADLRCHFGRRRRRRKRPSSACRWVLRYRNQPLTETMNGYNQPLAVLMGERCRKEERCFVFIRGRVCGSIGFLCMYIYILLLYRHFVLSCYSIYTRYYIYVSSFSIFVIVFFCGWTAHARCLSRAS